MDINLFAIGVIGLSVFCAPVACAEPPVLEWVEVRTDDRTAEYLNELGGVLARMKALRPETESTVFRAAYAGTNTGIVYVLNRFPSLEYFAASVRVFEADATYLDGLAELRETGRVITAESLLLDVTPGEE